MTRFIAIPALAGALLLAGSGRAAADFDLFTVHCKVPKPPAVSVTPVSDDVVYDFATPSRALSRMRSDMASPFPPGADTATGGLRVDQPVLSFKVGYSRGDYPRLGKTCLWYTEVKIDIHLSPHIYIAREFSSPGPCRSAVMQHELHHVEIDREMMNKYSDLIGRAVRDVVNGTGPVGPIPSSDAEVMGRDLTERVSQAITAAEEPLQDEMRARQGQVDSLAEYRRISDVCRDIRIAP